MNYLDHRVENFKQFQTILDREESKNCGDRLQLQMIENDPNSVIVPQLNYLGNGVYGFAFSLHDQQLSDRNMNVVVKISKSTHAQNIMETGYGLVISKIVENGDCPNLPLYAHCKGGPNKEECICIGNCNFNNQINGLDRVNPSSRSNLQTIMNEKCFVSFAEKLDGNLSRFFIEMGQQRVSQEDFAKHFFSAISQVIFGLKELSDHGLAHTDLHSENILIKQHITADPMAQPYLKYTYDNDAYAINHMDTLCVVWDFGFIGKKGKLLTSHGFSDAFMDRIFFQETQNWKRWKTSLLYDIARLIAHFKMMFETNRIISARYPIVSAYINRLFMALTSLLNINDNEKNRTEEPLFYLKELFPNLIKDPMLRGWWNETVKINRLINNQQILKSYPSSQNVKHLFHQLEIESQLPIPRWSPIVQQQQAQLQQPQLQPQLQVNPNNYNVLLNQPPLVNVNAYNNPLLNQPPLVNAYNNLLLNQPLQPEVVQPQSVSPSGPLQLQQSGPLQLQPVQPVQFVQAQPVQPEALQQVQPVQFAQQPVVNPNLRYPSDLDDILDAYYGFRSFHSKKKSKRKNRRSRRSIKKKTTRKNRK